MNATIKRKSRNGKLHYKKKVCEVFLFEKVVDNDRGHFKLIRQSFTQCY